MTITLDVEDFRKLKQQMYSHMVKASEQYLEDLRPFVEQQIMPTFDEQARKAMDKFRESCVMAPVSFSV